MNPPVPSDLLQQVQQLFDEVVDLPAEERSRVISERSSGNEQLQQEVESLLQAMDASGSFAQEKLEGLYNALHSLPMSIPRNSKEDPFVGRKFSHYEIQEKVGGGGMGVVYKALDVKLQRTVAIKVLPASMSLEPDAKKRFLLEARAASRLDHENICIIHEITEIEPELLCIVMAYYEGETLRQKLNNRRVSLSEAIDIAKQLIEGLIRAHQEGIIHRDIKPANIMIREDGVLKVLDFGVAKVGSLAQITKTGSTLGTASYMSPEQLMGGEVDHRIDIWATGVVLYEMLTGSRPFKGEYFHAIAYGVTNTDPEPLTQLNRDIPVEVEDIVLKCLKKDTGERYQTMTALLSDIFRVEKKLASMETEAVYRAPSVGSKEAPLNGDVHGEPATIYISYDSTIESDRRVGDALRDAMNSHHMVFTNTHTSKGGRWVQAMQSELSQSSFLIVLISAKSIRSELVLTQIEIAHRLAQDGEGYPIILPVRLAYNQPYVYPLNAYLDDLNWANWNSEEDTDLLIDKLIRAVSRGNLSSTNAKVPRIQQKDPTGSIPEPLAAAQVMSLEAPEGTMDVQSKFYIRRPADEVAENAIAQQGVTITIKGPRQMGKSSLLVRMMDRAMKMGKKVLFLDFQLFSQSAFKDADTFFKQFAVWLTFKLKVENRVEEYWQWPLGNSQCCTMYMEDCILNELDGSVVLAMDEVERVFDTDFRSDFFGMLRSWHNERAKTPAWKKLDLALITSTEPYQLIENLNQSPFNVGEIIDLTDFTGDQVSELNQRHGSPLNDGELGDLMDLLNGHPYLTRKALYLVASERYSWTELKEQMAQEKGPFSDHLRNHLFRLHDQEMLSEGFKQVIQRNKCSDEDVYWRLQGAGLVLREGKKVIPRNALYAEYFKEHLHV